MGNTLLIIRILCSANRPLEYMNQSYLVVEVVHAMDGVVAGAVGVVFAAALGEGEDGGYDARAQTSVQADVSSRSP